MLVTGGDSAIGRAAAIAYAKEGADVAINYLPSEQEDAEEVEEVITSAGQQAVLIPGDLRNEQFNYELVERAYHALGGLDNVTLVAGHQQYRDTLKGFDTASFTETFETNVYPIFWTVQKRLIILNQVLQLRQRHLYKVITQVQFYMIMQHQKLQSYR